MSRNEADPSPPSSSMKEMEEDDDEFEELFDFDGVNNEISSSSNDIQQKKMSECITTNDNDDDDLFDIGSPRQGTDPNDYADDDDDEDIFGDIPSMATTLKARDDDIFGDISNTTTPSVPLTITNAKPNSTKVNLDDGDDEDIFGDLTTSSTTTAIDAVANSSSSTNAVTNQVNIHKKGDDRKKDNDTEMLDDVLISTSTSTDTTREKDDALFMLESPTNNNIAANNSNSAMTNSSSHTTSNDDHDAFYHHDSGSRDFLEWLDEPKSSTTASSTKATTAQKISMKMTVVLEDDNNHDDHDDDDDVDFLKDDDDKILNNASNNKTTIRSSSHDTTEASVDEFEDIMSSIPTTNTGDDDDDNDDSEDSNGFLKCSKPKSTSQSISHSNDDTTIQEQEKQEELLPFDTLIEAVQMSNVTCDQIRKFVFSNNNNNEIWKQQWVEDNDEDNNENRKYIWVKLLTNGKTYDDIRNGSCADSFTSWMTNSTNHNDDTDNNNNNNTPLHNLSVQLTQQFYNHDHSSKLQQNQLYNLLSYHYQTKLTPMKTHTSKNDKPESLQEQNDDSHNDNGNDANNHSDTVKSKDADISHIVDGDAESFPLAAVAAWLLHVGMEPPVASVLLSSYIPSVMPLLTLDDNDDNNNAVHSLQQQLYLLACYHTPTLVMHLDRHVPSWQHITLPTTMFSSNFISSPISTTIDDDNYENNKINLLDRWMYLWDIWILLSLNKKDVIMFFFICALLDQHSDTLLMLRGEALQQELIYLMTHYQTQHKSNMSLSLLQTHNLMAADDDNGNHNNSNFGDECDDNDMVIMSTNINSSSEELALMMSRDQILVDKWYQKAWSLKEQTPESVLDKLSKAQDIAIHQSLLFQNKRAEELLQQRLKEEADQHRTAMEEARAEDAKVKQLRIYKFRLHNYYKRHNPTKTEAEVDKIFEIYKDKLELLDHRLREKYNNHGFMPVTSTQIILSERTNQLIHNVGHGFQIKRKELMAQRAERRAKKLEQQIHKDDPHSYDYNGHHSVVSVTVTSNEVLPNLFTTPSNTNVTSLSHSQSPPLKYFLVDSRPADVAQEQGRFPIGMRLSPEQLMDADLYHQQVDKFESLRGAVHICILGVGFSALERLYDHPSSLLLEQQTLLQDDESRTNICALFFIKKGFPFVSILDGGFAAAHAWLFREGAKHNIPVTSVLVDYDAQTSLFAQLENNHGSHASNNNNNNKTKVIQNLLDQSMVKLTMSEYRIDNFTKVGRQKIKESMKESSQNIKQSMSKLMSSKRNTSSNTDKPAATIESNNNTSTFTTIFGSCDDSVSLKSISIEEEEEEEGEEEEGNNVTTTNVNEQKEQENNTKTFKISWGFRNNNSDDSTGTVNENDTRLKTTTTTTSFVESKNDVNDKVATNQTKLGQQTKALLSRRNNLFAGLKSRGATTNVLQTTEDATTSSSSTTEERQPSNNTNQEQKLLLGDDKYNVESAPTTKVPTKFSLLSRNNPFSGLKVSAPSRGSGVKEDEQSTAATTKTITQAVSMEETEMNKIVDDLTKNNPSKFGEKLSRFQFPKRNKNNSNSNNSVEDSTKKLEGQISTSKSLPFLKDDSSSSKTMDDQVVPPVVKFGEKFRLTFTKKTSIDDDIEKEIEATLKQLEKDNGKKKITASLSRFKFGSKIDMTQDSNSNNNKTPLSTSFKNKLENLKANMPKKSSSDNVQMEEEDVLFLNGEEDVSITQTGESSQSTTVTLTESTSTGSDNPNASINAERKNK